MSEKLSESHGLRFWEHVFLKLENSNTIIIIIKKENQRTKSKKVFSKKLIAVCLLFWLSRISLLTHINFMNHHCLIGSELPYYTTWCPVDLPIQEAKHLSALLQPPQSYFLIFTLTHYPILLKCKMTPSIFKMWFLTHCSLLDGTLKTDCTHRHE